MAQLARLVKIVLSVRIEYDYIVI